LPPEGFNIGIIALERKIIKHAVVLVYVIKFLGKVLHFVGSVLNEIAGLYQLALISRLLHNCLVHVFICLVDFLDGALAPFVDLLLQLVFDFEGLMAQTLFHSGGNNSK
jgi:hypothetical protein